MQTSAVTLVLSTRFEEAVFSSSFFSRPVTTLFTKPVIILTAENTEPIMIRIETIGAMSEDRTPL